MDNLIKLGRLNYAIGMAGLGLQQFYFPGFRPVFVPSWPEGMPDPQVLVYLSSVCLIISGIFIVSSFRARKTSLFLGSVLLLLFIVAHVPFLISNNTTSLGGWTDAFKFWPYRVDLSWSPDRFQFPKMALTVNFSNH